MHRVGPCSNHKGACAVTTAQAVIMDCMFSAAVCECVALHIQVSRTAAGAGSAAQAGRGDEGQEVRRGVPLQEKEHRRLIRLRGKPCLLARCSNSKSFQRQCLRHGSARQVWYGRMAATLVDACKPQHLLHQGPTVSTVLRHWSFYTSGMLHATVLDVGCCVNNCWPAAWHKATLYRPLQSDASLR